MILVPLLWIPWLIYFFGWRRGYDIQSPVYEFEMPLLKKSAFVIKWNFNGEAASFSSTVSKK